MHEPAVVLVCFAVPEEARHFRTRIPKVSACRILVTGMGQRNAQESLRRSLAESTPHLVISSGFAGGLNPQLEIGALVFDAASDSRLVPTLTRLGATAARFHCAERIASLATEKAKLRQVTGADAVEMESKVIREMCAIQNIPAATVRIISDTANEDLPLDFNKLMTPDQRMNYPKLAWTLATSPTAIGKLWGFRRRIDSCSAKLAAALSEALADFRGKD